MARGAPVDRRALAAGVARDMRAHIDRTKFLDRVSGILTLVGAERDGARPIGKALDHIDRRRLNA
jgi:hypothetical protein